MTNTTLKAAILGLGLVAGQVAAQATTTGSSSTGTTNQTTTGAGTDAQTSTSTTNTFRDGKMIIGATLSTTGGRYGTISDLVYDGTGAVRYALVEHQGQTHVVPFSLLRFGATGDVTVSASSAALDAVTVDRNNLKNLASSSFLTQLRAAYGPNATAGLTNPAGIVPGTGAGNANPNSTAGQRNALYSLSSLLGGTISSQTGVAGNISNVAISPNGLIAYAVGSTTDPNAAGGNIQFAVPFPLATLSTNGSGLTVNLSTQTLTSATLTAGTFPSFSDQAFASAIVSAFGSQANSIFPRFLGGTTQSTVATRNDPFRNDPVVRAGDASQAGANAVAAAGDPRRGGMSAVERAGDRASNGANNTSGLTRDPNTGLVISGNTAPSGSPSGVTTGTTTGGNTSAAASTGGIVNVPQDVATTTAATNVGANGVFQLRDLLNFKVMAQDGAFGRVADVVVDRNGNVQFLLGSNQGQFFPLPFTPTAFSGTPGTLTFDIPMATLSQLAINPQDLPSLANQAFVSRMQQVFGPTFGTSTQTTSFFPPTGTNTGATGSTTGTTGATTGSAALGTTGTQATPQGNIGTTGLSTRRSTGTGTTGTNTGTTGTNTGTTGTNTGTAGATTGTTGGAAGMSARDSWQWPTFGRTGGSSLQAPPPGSPFQNKYPPNGIKTFTPANRGTGTTSGSGTKSGSGTGTLQAPPPGSPFQNDYPPNGIKTFGTARSKSGNTNNSGVGTGGRTVNPPPRGNATGGDGSGSSGGAGSSGTSGSSGSGGSGGSSGSGS